MGDDRPQRAPRPGHRTNGRVHWPYGRACSADKDGRYDRWRRSDDASGCVRGCDVVTFTGLLAHNVWRRRLRSLVTAVAVAIGVTAVLALGVLTNSLRDTAVAVLQLGKADFSVSQKGASDVLYSTMTEQEINAIGAMKGVDSAIGVFVQTGKIERAAPVLHRGRTAPEG